VARRDTRDRRVSFLVAVFGAGLELFGAIVGQGMLGEGMLFGAAGPGTAILGALVGIACALVSLVAGVLLMFVRDVRPLAVLIVVAGLFGSLAAGPQFALGAGVTCIGAVIALSVDRSASLI
jgi:hypothetical protein